MSRRTCAFRCGYCSNNASGSQFPIWEADFGYDTVHTYYQVLYGIMRRLIELYPCGLVAGASSPRGHIGAEPGQLICGPDVIVGNGL